MAPEYEYWPRATEGEEDRPVPGTKLFNPTTNREEAMNRAEKMAKDHPDAFVVVQVEYLGE